MSLESISKKRAIKLRRKRKIRGRITGTISCPRMSVYKSLSHLYVQLIDDVHGKVLLSMHDKAIAESDKLKKMDIAIKFGRLFAQKVKTSGITKVVFDRCGNKYHGRVRAFADGAREEGLIF